jgi:hypothetical protein
MFRIHEVKNTKQAEDDKPAPIEEDRLTSFQDIAERRMPYLSIVPEQAEADATIQGLSPEVEGQFFRLCFYVLWPACGAVTDHDLSIARRLRLTVQQWQKLRQLLLDAGLLEVVADGEKLMNRDLRYQYLDTLRAADNKRRSKKKKPG